MTRNLPHNDPTGARLALARASADLAKPGAQTPAQWCAFAVALGRCRLYAIDPGADLDCTLSVEQARLAAQGLRHELADRAIQAKELGQKWDATDDHEETLLLVCSYLQDRMEAWAAMVAIDEAYEAGLHDGVVDLPELVSLLRDITKALDAFDGALLQELALLSLAVGTGLLDRWRNALAEEFKEENPWWLDGRLERENQRITNAAKAVRSVVIPISQARPQPKKSGKWPALLPRFREQRELAVAGDKPVSRTGVGKTLRWLSPDGLYRAELNLPSETDEKQQAIPRPVNFLTVEDEDKASALNGQVVRLGQLELTIDNAKFVVTLAQLARLDDQEIFALEVGTPAVTWPLSLESEIKKP